MHFNQIYNNRQSIRLQSYDYSWPGLYFVTMCVKDFEYLFGEVKDGRVELNEYGKIVDKYWKAIGKKYKNVRLDEYIIMANHFHGIIEIRVGAIHELPEQKMNELPKNMLRRKMLLSKIIGYFKMNSAKQINLIRETKGSTVWQRNYYEHIIRNEYALERIRYYIRNNPWNWKGDSKNKGC